MARPTLSSFNVSRTRMIREIIAAPGNLSDVAGVLGCHRKTVHRLVTAYGLASLAAKKRKLHGVPGPRSIVVDG